MPKGTGYGTFEETFGISQDVALTPQFFNRCFEFCTFAIAFFDQYL